ncbi:hypothetical protein [Defluviicoccus vanus]|uniref:Uncharacterized protein n=1 Tax=Defluviicoccus vanus TaxID=111831 RepID=A0A7H1N2V7_9PROT|nr:hypothetical protein [Defluviicoccus vanus]QNT70043.1 hypothetical protein HQ394_12745 [Defluviicoccus vanus]
MPGTVVRKLNSQEVVPAAIAAPPAATTIKSEIGPASSFRMGNPQMKGKGTAASARTAAAGMATREVSGAVTERGTTRRVTA